MRMTEKQFQEIHFHKSFQISKAQFLILWKLIDLRCK